MAAIGEFFRKAWFGSAFMAMGVLICAMVVTHPEGAEAPVWVVLVAGGTFFFAGVSVLARTFGSERLGLWLALPVVYGLAVPGLWILLAGDGARCMGGVGVGGLSLTGLVDGLLCRGVFGLGALLVLVMAVAFTIAAIRRGRGGVRPGGNVVPPVEGGPSQ